MKLDCESGTQDCADTAIIRTPSRRELLYTRSQIVITAKAFGLDAIDMVCVDFRDLEILTDECIDGRQLGFTGKVLRLLLASNATSNSADTVISSKRSILRRSL